MNFEMPRPVHAPADSERRGGKKSPESNNSEMDLLQRDSRKILRDSIRGTSRYNWLYAFTFPSVCKYVIQSLRENVSANQIEVDLVDKVKNTTIASINPEHYQPLISAAEKWDELCSLTGITPDSNEEFTAMRARARRCADGTETGISWNTFIHDATNREYLIRKAEEVLPSCVGDNKVQLQALIELSQNLSRRLPHEDETLRVTTKRVSPTKPKKEGVPGAKPKDGSTGLVQYVGHESTTSGRSTQSKGVLERLVIKLKDYQS